MALTSKEKETVKEALSVYEYEQGWKFAESKEWNTLLDKLWKELKL